MYVYGRNVAKEILKGKNKIHQVFIAKNFNDKEIIDELNKKHIKFKYLDKNELNKKVEGNHQGIIIDIDDYKYAKIEELTNENIIVMLDHLEDPHNFGAIIRTCEAAGIKSIIIPKDRSVAVTPTVVKVSVGTIENVKIARVNNLVNTIKELKKQGFWVIGTDMDGQNFTEIDYQGKIVLIIGSEGKGMSRLVKENCDFIASIPMQGTVNSLNASVAAALIIYEATRSNYVRRIK